MKEIKWNGEEKIVRELCPDHTLEIELCGDGIKLMVYWVNNDNEKKLVERRIISSKSLTGDERKG